MSIRDRVQLPSSALHPKTQAAATHMLENFIVVDWYGLLGWFNSRRSKLKVVEIHTRNMKWSE